MSTKISSYEQQARDFLKATKTEYACFYFDHKPYFPDDKESRDIYTVRLRNFNHSYMFKFGQSIANTGKAPSAYSVLACITKYDPGTFEQFCGDYGYDTDSRKAEKTYKAVVEEWQNIRTLFTPEELEKLQEIQ